MPFRLRFFAVGVSFLLLLIVVELIRRKRLRERYALLWIGAALIFLLLSLKIELLVWIAAQLGFMVPANALFVFGMLSGTVIILAMTVAISSMARRSERLAQEIALLNRKVEELDLKKENV